MNTIEVVICSGCLGKNYKDEFELEEILVQVETRLEQIRPDRKWNLNSQACFRFCPKDRITISVADRIAMTKEATVDSIVNEILSFLKK